MGRGTEGGRWIQLESDLRFQESISEAYKNFRDICHISEVFMPVCVCACVCACVCVSVSECVRAYTAQCELVVRGNMVLMG